MSDRASSCNGLVSDVHKLQNSAPSRRAENIRYQNMFYPFGDDNDPPSGDAHEAQVKFSFSKVCCSLGNQDTKFLLNVSIQIQQKSQDIKALLITIKKLRKKC